MHELALRLPEHLVEAICDALVESQDALSVSVADADAGTEAEHALFGEPGLPAPRAAWQRSELTALFADEARATAAAALLRAQHWAGAVEVLALREVADQDWVRLTQSQFAPVAITEAFWIVPSWHEAPPQARRVIRLDPGLAFGTGTHPTTRMCLRWIARHAAAEASGNAAAAVWPRVLDYGCGSGILAIAAALHGAPQVDAVDIDAAAVRATRDNATANAVMLHAGSPDIALGRYALVLANILATPLKLLAPLLCGHLDRGGQLVLAGILERQAGELQAAYAPWLALEVADTDDGWILMTGRLAGVAPRAPH